MKNQTWLLMLAVAAVLAMGLKAYLILARRVPFNADEAIVALMARHILQGAHPTFFYGQAYMGSLDAWLVALGFRLFGQHVAVIRWIQAALYLGTLLTTAWLGWRIFQSRRIALYAALLLAIPTVNVTLYTTASLGGYGEALLIGNLLLLLALQIEERPHLVLYLIWAALAGFGFWVFGLTAIYILPSSVLIVYALFRSGPIARKLPLLLMLGLALIVGASPILFWAAENGLAEIFKESLGSAIAGASPGSYGVDVLYHAYGFLLFGPTVIWGLRPPWGATWLAVPLLPFVLAFWLMVLVHMYLRFQRGEDIRAGHWLLLGLSVTTVLGFILSPFGADPSGRYFVPLAIPLSLFAADMLERWAAARMGHVWAWCMLGVILVFNLWGNLASAHRYPPGLTTQFDPVARVDHRHDQALIDFLKQTGEDRGFSNYWVSYPIAFKSEEQIIFVPHLPYHQDFRYTARDDRYEPYTEWISESKQIAYVTTNHPGLNARLRAGFAREGIMWQEKIIGDYHVFYALSERITPDELGVYELSSEP